MDNASPAARSAAIYCRGVIPELELNSCERFAEARGWTVSDVYLDAGKRPSRDDRPQYARMIEDISSGSLDAVIVTDVSRLTRDAKEWEFFVSICLSGGVKFIASAIDDKVMDSTTLSLVARMLSYVNKREKPSA